MAKEQTILDLLRQKAQPWANFPTDPVGYARTILGVELTSQQREIILAVLEPPYMVHVDSAHSTGKTFLAAVLANWWYDQFDPGVIITTAPTERDVVDLLWTEIRLLRQRAKARHPGLPMKFIGPSAPEMHDTEEHWAKGYTARKGESFQGRHRTRMLFLFDENEGIDAPYFTTTKSMFKPEEGHAWFSIGNPTTTSSAAYLETQTTNEDGTPKWRVFRMSALEHPNIEAELKGEPPLIPNAVTLAQLDSWINDWTEAIAPEDRVVTDFEWRPGSGKWRRPGPIGCARILGRRPTQGTYGVWSAELFEACEKNVRQIDLSKLPEIGCDVARFGDDWTVFHVRWGSVSLYHEAVNGWATNQTANRLKQLCEEYALFATRERRAAQPHVREITHDEIVVKIDDGGVGGGVVDQGAGYRFVGIGAGSTANADEMYPNRRSELWFDVAERAQAGLLDLSRLPPAVRLRLKVQALQPVWKLDAADRRVVEPKEATKKRLVRSPDDMDAVNLAYTEWYGETASWVGPSTSRPENGETMGKRMGILGQTSSAGPRQPTRGFLFGRR